MTAVVSHVEGYLKGPIAGVTSEETAAHAVEIELDGAEGGILWLYQGDDWIEFPLNTEKGVEMLIDFQRAFNVEVERIKGYKKVTL